MSNFRLTPGRLVRLVRTTKELAADGLQVGQLGTVGITPDGALGVEFRGYSDTGWNAGLHTLVIRTREDNGKTVLVTDLCEAV